MTDKLTTLQPLRDRVAKATGPDREIDADLYKLDEYCTKLPHYTSSIDAALALVERVLPGKWPTILLGAVIRLADAHAWHMRRCDQDPSVLASAILLAGLDALIAQEKVKTDV